MYRIVVALTAVSVLGLLVSLGLDVTGVASGKAVWGSALGLSLLGHAVAIAFLGASGVQVRNEVKEGRRPTWASAQAERNVRRVVPTTVGAVVVVIAAGWVTMAASAEEGSVVLGVVSRVATAVAAGVSIGAHGWEVLSSRTQNRLAMSHEEPGRPRIAGRFTRVEPEPEPEPEPARAGESL